MKPLLLMLLLALSGCAAFGTRSNLTAEVAPGAVRQVALVITRQATNHAPYNKTIDSLFIKEIITQLSASGAAVAFVGGAEELLADEAAFRRLGQRYDAVLHAEINLKGDGRFSYNSGCNSWVRMQAFRISEKKLLGESYFNTLMGKSYWVSPDLYDSIHDGVAGALRPWLKRLAAAR